MKKLKLLLAFCALLIGWSNASAETDYTNRMSDTWTGQTGGFQGGSERYQNSTNVAGKIMYQSFTAPATGIYEIKFYAVTSSTAERDGGVEKIYGPNIAQAYATAGENKAVVGMNVIAQTGCTLVQDANIRTLSVEATAGETIEYGLENIAKGGNWYTIKALSAKMKTVAEIFQAQYDEAYAIWEHSTENEVGAKATFKGYVDALNTAMSGTLAAAQEASDNLAAQLVIYESKSYPVKGSGVKYDFTSKMSMAINAWTCKQGNGPAQYGFTGATETYGNTGVGDVMYQTISGLANGEYEIHFYAVANAANGGGVGGSKTIVYANDQENEIDVITQSSCTPSDYERTFTVMVTDGSIKYGFKNTVAAGNWYICKNVALYMTGAPDLSDYYEAIAGKLTTANGLKSSPMKSTVLSALQDAIDATEGYGDITVIGTLETMSDNLTTAINNANTSISNYEEALSVLNAASNLDAAGQASYAGNETVAAIQSAYDARTLENVSSEQKDVCASALRTAAKAQTTEGADMTLAIVNPSFETGNTTGWTYEVSNDHGAKLNSNDTYTMTNCDGNYLFNIWSSGNVISQEIASLRNGVYKLSAYVATDADHQVQINGGNQNVKIDAVNKGTGVKGEVTFTVLNNTAVIGAEGVNKYWYKVDDFRLTYVRAATVADYKEVLNGAITSANGARKSANEGTGVFQIPAAAGTTLAGAITDAQNVYDNVEATISDVTTAISTLNTAVETYEATTLNAPDAEKLYNVILTYAGYEYDGKAITYIANARNDMGLYNVKYLAVAPAAYKAQAFTFTQVSGNTYKMSQIDIDGNTRYLCTGVPYTGGNTSQIRTTTNANDALIVKIIATETANVFNIYNTEANNYIGSQDAGVFTVNSHINFTIDDAHEAPATFEASITSSIGVATLYTPYALDFSGADGLKAYTAEVSGDEVVVKEVSNVPANTGVILKGAVKSYDIPVIASSETAKGDLTGNAVDATAWNAFTGYDIYVLALNTSGDAQFQKTNEGSVAAGKAFLKIAQDSNVKVFNIVDGTATGVEAPEVAEAEEEEEILYNTAGVRVGKDYKGIVINQKGEKRLQK